MARPAAQAGRAPLPARRRAGEMGLEGIEPRSDQHGRNSNQMLVCAGMATACTLGAQTGRRGDAGPVRGLLGGKDPTGRVYPKTFQTPDNKQTRALPT